MEWSVQYNRSREMVHSFTSPCPLLRVSVSSLVMQSFISCCLVGHRYLSRCSLRTKKKREERERVERERVEREWEERDEDWAEKDSMGRPERSVRGRQQDEQGPDGQNLGSHLLSRDPRPGDDHRKGWKSSFDARKLLRRPKN